MTTDGDGGARARPALAVETHPRTSRGPAVRRVAAGLSGALLLSGGMSRALRLLAPAALLALIACSAAQAPRSGPTLVVAPSTR